MVNVFYNFGATLLKKYLEVWRGKNEADNPLQSHYMDMIQSEKQVEVEKEARQVVDEAMRQELELLNAVIFSL